MFNSQVRQQSILKSSGHPNSSNNANTTPLDHPKPVCIVTFPSKK